MLLVNRLISVKENIVPIVLGENGKYHVPEFRLSMLIGFSKEHHILYYNKCKYFLRIHTNPKARWLYTYYSQVFILKQWYPVARAKGPLLPSLGCVH